jgi:hypothetical protein
LNSLPDLLRPPSPPFHPLFGGEGRSSFSSSVMVRPTTGALDLATKTMQGVSALGEPNHVARKRLPRTFGDGKGGVPPFDSGAALRTLLLDRCGFRKTDGDGVAHYHSGKDVFIVTPLRFLKVTLRGQLRWEIPFSSNNRFDSIVFCFFLG